jgi:cyclophilin family peptidyl-prolyl cis-trans isomerase/uncharacterized damage-inducible protein DinB
MSGALLELYRHKTWATLRLLDHCRGIADEHLDATIPGTYGTIRETLRHLVDSEEGYFRLATGERLSEPLPDGPAPLDELAERIRRLGPRWEAAAEVADLQAREVKTNDGWRLPASVPMAQAIHHADDHRSHILSIIGARGLEVPELDIWAYAESAGQMQVDPSRRFTAMVHTARGDFVIALAGPKADWSAVNRFVYVAQNKFYDGLAFQRVLAGSVVECGDSLEQGAGGSPPIERDGDIPSSWSRGTAGMAFGASGVIRSGFFVTLADATLSEHGSYGRLGLVTVGMKVVDRIQAGDKIISLEISAS